MIRSSEQAELWFWSALPGLMTFFLAILSMSAKHIVGLAQIMPLLPLIPVFYWGMTHARGMPYWFVFALGLVMDAISGLPLGLSSLLYMVFLALLHAQRRFFQKEGFVIKWGYFALLLGLIGSLNWFTLSLFYSHPLPASPAVIQWWLTVCCYPVLHKAFDALNDYIYARRWHILHGG